MDTSNVWGVSSEKARENRLRRLAERLGFVLHKDRARLWAVDHQGGYKLVDAYTGAIQLGAYYEATLDTVEAFLGPAAERRRKSFQEFLAASEYLPDPVETRKEPETFESFLRRVGVVPTPPDPAPGGR